MRVNFQRFETLFSIRKGRKRKADDVARKPNNKVKYKRKGKNFLQSKV
jgi:hypothetical protein